MARTFEPGLYKGKIADWQIGEASTKNPQVAFVIDIEARLEGGKEVPAPSLKRTVYRVITEKTVEYLVKDLRALGYDADSFDELDRSHPNHFDFTGKNVRVELKYEMYEGKEKERWNFSLGGGGPNMEALAGKEISRLNAQFGSAFKKSPLRNGGGMSKPAAPPVAAAGDEETPF